MARCRIHHRRYVHGVCAWCMYMVYVHVYVRVYVVCMRVCIFSVYIARCNRCLLAARTYGPRVAHPPPQVCAWCMCVVCVHGVCACVFYYLLFLKFKFHCRSPFLVLLLFLCLFFEYIFIASRHPCSGKQAQPCKYLCKELRCLHHSARGST